MNWRGAIWIACKKPAITLLIIFFLLSISSSLAICGCKEKTGESNLPAEKGDSKIRQQFGGELISEKPAIVNFTQIIPHMRLKIIRPEYGEVFVGEEPDITLLAVTDTTCAGDVCNEREIVNVEFFEDSNFLGDANPINTGTEGVTLWEYHWNNVDQGTYTLTAKAIDCKNLTETSAPVSITSRLANVSPKTFITSPYDGQIFSEKEPIPLIVYAWDNDDNLAKVEIFEGLNKLFENNIGCEAKKNCSFHFTWINPIPRIYSLKAVASDEKGLRGTSPIVTINVKPNKALPNCTYTSPPSASTPISPYGSIGTDRPTFVWSFVPNSTSYRLVVNYQSVNVLDKLYNVAPSSLDMKCSDLSCSVAPFNTPSQLVPNIKYDWWIQTGNCYANGQWSKDMSFQITEDKPFPPNPIAPTGLISTSTPEFVWSSVHESTQYKLKVKNQDEKIIIDKIFDAEDVTLGYNCSTLSPTPLSNNGIFFWNVQAITDFSKSDESDEQYFETVCASPKKSAIQIEEYIETLSNQAFGISSDRRKSRLVDSLEEVKKRIDTGDYQRAIYMLDSTIRKRADGSIDGNKDDDWIVDPESQRKICGMIDDTINSLNSAKGST